MKNFDIELNVLRKWNHRLIIKEPSKRFIELVLSIDPNKDFIMPRHKWLLNQIVSKNCIFIEPASIINTYRLQTLSGKVLLIYYIRDIDVHEFENDIISVWDFLKNHCYDKEWWLKEYGQYLKRHPIHDLVLKKTKIIIGL